MIDAFFRHKTRKTQRRREEVMTRGVSDDADWGDLVGDLGGQGRTFLFPSP